MHLISGKSAGLETSDLCATFLKLNVAESTPQALSLQYYRICHFQWYHDSDRLLKSGKERDHLETSNGDFHSFQ
jgi:hypothetical protein